jgi:maltose/moltooligosaccharide transporter
MISSSTQQLPRKPRRSIYNLSIGYLGLNITFGIESASLSRVYQGFGASVDDLALLWLAGPVAGLVVQPLIGPISDRTWTRFGRRRPFMLVSAVVAILALLQLASAKNLATAIFMVWMLEFAMNALNAPYRALVGDSLPQSQQGEGFAMQTVFIGLGAFTGAFLPKLLALAGLSNLGGPEAAAVSVRVGFVFAALCLAISIAWTAWMVPEYSRADYDRMRVTLEQRPFAYPMSLTTFRGFARALWPYRKIATMQFFAWAGLYLLWVYATPVVTSHAFGASGPQDPRYAAGADWVGVMFGVYNGIAGVFAFLLPRLFRHHGVRSTHAIALAIGAIGFAGVAFLTSPWALLGCAILIGVAYASILSAPFVMASRIARAGAAGASMGIMNIFIVVPQLVMGLGMGAILARFFSEVPQAAFVIAAVFALVASMICIMGTQQIDS